MVIGSYSHEFSSNVNKIIVFRPETVAFRPETTAFRPENVAYHAETIVYGPETVVYRPENAIYHPENVVYHAENGIYHAECAVCGRVLACIYRSLMIVAGVGDSNCRMSNVRGLFSQVKMKHESRPLSKCGVRRGRR